MSEAVILALINAMISAASNSQVLAGLFGKLRAEGRDPTPEEWAALDAADSAARDSFQAVIDAMPDAPK